MVPKDVGRGDGPDGGQARGGSEMTAHEARRSHPQHRHANPGSHPTSITNTTVTIATITTSITSITSITISTILLLLLVLLLLLLLLVPLEGARRSGFDSRAHARAQNVLETGSE